MWRFLSPMLIPAMVIAATAACGGSSTESDDGSSTTDAASSSAAEDGGSSAGGDADRVRYHEPSQGWTTNVPLGWTSVVSASELHRGAPLSDPTRLVLRTYRDRTPSAALAMFAASEGIDVAAQQGERTGEHLHWGRYAGRIADAPELAVEGAVAKDGPNSHVVSLVARESELARLVETALLPALDDFAPGPPDASRSVLAVAPRDPPYWPTSGWRTATPESQGMDGRRLDAMMADIRTAKLPIDSVTVISHGYVVLDRRFEPFASGRLGEPYASGSPARAAVGDEVGQLDAARHRDARERRERRRR